jgi:hypothetical protein
LDVRPDAWLYLDQRRLSELIFGPAPDCNRRPALAWSPRRYFWRPINRRLTWQSVTTATTSPAFEVKSKRRRGYPSETRVKRGLRFVHGDVELVEKLGRNDPCPCGSGKCFQTLLHALGPVSTGPNGMIIGVNS